MPFVIYDDYRLMKFVGYDVCCIMTFVGYDVCRIMMYSMSLTTYFSVSLIGFVAVPIYNIYNIYNIYIYIYNIYISSENIEHYGYLLAVLNADSILC